MLQLNRFNISTLVGINANVPVFVRYWDLRSSTRSRFCKMSRIGPWGRQPKEFADPSGDSVCLCSVDFVSGSKIEFQKMQCTAGTDSLGTAWDKLCASLAHLL